MTRKKESAQPMLALKGEFQDSLDNLCQAAMNLMFAVETALELGHVNAAATVRLKEQVNALRAALTADD